MLVINQRVAIMVGLSPSQIKALSKKKEQEIAVRIKKIRAGRQAPKTRGRIVILVDDGLATGATALSTVRLIKKMGAA